MVATLSGTRSELTPEAARPHGRFARLTSPPAWLLTPTLCTETRVFRRGLR
jgi:hypothetical protein